MIEIVVQTRSANATTKTATVIICKTINGELRAGAGEPFSSSYAVPWSGAGLNEIADSCSALARLAGSPVFFTPEGPNTGMPASETKRREE